VTSITAREKDRRTNAMGIAERKEREREEVRRKILDAAHELFETEGYERVTMRRIAEAIEYSPTTIYNHFEDKDDLVNALCHEDFSRLLSAMAEHPAPTDPVECIRHLGRAYAAFGLRNPNHYRFMFMTPAKFEHPHEAALPGQEAFGFLRAAVARAIEQGQFQNGSVDTMAQVLWSGIHGAVALLITLDPGMWPQAPAAPDLVDQVIENGIRGFLKERN
jgi:AcrR family transcriptional regulator